MCLFANAILQLCVLQCSFSAFFREHVLLFLVGLHLLRSVLRLAVTDYMCETLLAVPIHTVSQVTYMVSLLSTKTLFDFLTAYIIISGIQMIDRVYISPMEDFVIGRVMRVVRTSRRYLEWLRSLRRHSKKELEDDDSDDEFAAQRADPALAQATEADHQAASAEGDTEDMIGFCVSLSTVALGNLLAPLFFALCTWLYDDSKILYTYGIRAEHAMYYVIFYAIQFVFQFLTDILSINTVELYHGWHVTDYLEYCIYRFRVRKQVWKGRETVYDETLAPHQRSVDQMCFSEQFYFMNTLCVVGVLAWMFGMQVCFVSQWNLFQDPAMPVIALCGLVICRGAHVTTLISAGYLKIWMVKKDGVLHAHQMADSGATGLAATNSMLEAKKKLVAPPPPPGSCHEGWPEPPPYDKAGLERYRMAFLRENQLWLQSAFAELEDNHVIVQQREAMLEQLAHLIGQMPPSKFGPEGELSEAAAQADNLGLRFGEVPPTAVARAAREVQYENFQGSIAQEIVRMWREQARFSLHLRNVTGRMRLKGRSKGSSCEVCGKTSPLEIAPIYTLIRLASSYRQQRDMSPLWNGPLWRHFYQTFTPTCTICDECNAKYFRMNCDLPVDEGRFQRLQAKKKTVHAHVMDSDLPVAPIASEAVELLHIWLGFTRALAAGEEPAVFLPRFGFEGRTAAEIRHTKMLEEANENAEQTSLPSLSGSEREGTGEEEEAPQRRRQREETEEVANKAPARPIMDVRDIDLDEEDEPPGRPLALRAPLTWSETAILGSWLRRARQRLQAPQLSDWSRPLPLPPRPDLPGPPRPSVRDPSAGLSWD
uniref:Uncharacterized protein n=1 Tax=Alexandrium monilatum TaxID=311494 RepID=A0A7S4Q5Y7_9DINO